jgi:hypothetical protein
MCGRQINLTLVGIIRGGFLSGFEIYVASEGCLLLRQYLDPLVPP